MLITTLTFDSSFNTNFMHNDASTPSTPEMAKVPENW